MILIEEMLLFISQENGLGVLSTPKPNESVSHLFPARTSAARPEQQVQPELFVSSNTHCILKGSLLKVFVEL